MRGKRAGQAVATEQTGRAESDLHSGAQPPPRKSRRAESFLRLRRVALYGPEQLRLDRIGPTARAPRNMRQAADTRASEGSAGSASQSRRCDGTAGERGSAPGA